MALKRLLVHARNFKGNFDSLVAGFVETGESLEEAVHLHEDISQKLQMRFEDLECK